MKNLLLVMMLIGIATAHAHKVEGVVKNNVDYFEINHSLNSICSASLKLKDSQGVLVKEFAIDVYGGKVQLKVPTETLENSDFVILMADCGLDPLRMMFVGQDLEFVSGSLTVVPARMQFSVVMKDGSIMPVEAHQARFNAFQSEDSFGNKSAIIENKSVLMIDMVKFK